MTLYDHAAELFPNGNEMHLSDLDTKLKPHQVFQVLVSDKTYLRKKVDGSIRVGHLYHPTSRDGVLELLMGEKTFSNFRDDQYGIPRSLNIAVEYMKGALVLLRRGVKSDVPEIQRYFENYIRPENQDAGPVTGNM